MAIQTVRPYGDQIQMTIDGHHVTISFTQEENPTLSALVRSTLLDAYIRKNDLSGEEQFAQNKNALLKCDFTGSEARSLLLLFQGSDSYST